MCARSVFSVGLVSLLTLHVAAEEFRGWQGMRVVEQDGRPSILRAGDVDRDGYQELIVVNGRYSRLEVYHWLDEAERTEPEPSDRGRPNDLPMTKDIRREEVQLEYLPQDVLVRDLDADGSPELIILVSPPNRVIVYEFDPSEGWRQQYRIDLLEGEIPPRRQAMLVRETDDDVDELLVSFSDGIQRLPLQPNARASWLTPREKRDRSDWWLADLDGDGNQDLIEQTRDANEAIRWYPCSRDGELIPAQVLFDRAISGAGVLRVNGGTELILLDGSVQGLIRRYKISTGEASLLGARFPIPLPGGRNSVWCAMALGDEQALIVADPNRPQFLSYRMGLEGWQAERAYPAISNIQAVVAPVASPETLLIWANDAADLQVSRWNSERLTYPEPWPKSAEISDRKILALQRVGNVTWWVQKVDNDLDLYRWFPDQEEPSTLRFSGAASKADQVLWIGGDRLLVKDALARGLRLVVLKDGETVSSSPTHLDRAALTEFRLLAVDDEQKLARLVNGVLQWLGEDLLPNDQIMLPDGLEIADYVAMASAEGWALQNNAPYLHRLEADESGVIRSTDRVKVTAGTSLVNDPLLGLFLVAADRITLLREGHPRELQLVDVIDKRVGKPGGVRETRFHRIGTTDTDGDGCDELILFDDMEHRLSALSWVAGELLPQIAWLVFDDKIYPYSDETASLVSEPRAVWGLDFDGDEQRDLAMLCHDRLLLYLGCEKK